MTRELDLSSISLIGSHKILFLSAALLLSP